MIYRGCSRAAQRANVGTASRRYTYPVGNVGNRDVRIGEQRPRHVKVVLIKPNQAGTISETWAALEASRDCGLATIVSARSGETEDVTIAHLAVGWDAGQFKVGSIARGERTAKWNEVLRIEAELGAGAVFSGGAALRPPLP